LHLLSEVRLCVVKVGVGDGNSGVAGERLPKDDLVAVEASGSVA
jgi:hypothetical protein